MDDGRRARRASEASYPTLRARGIAARRARRGASRALGKRAWTRALVPLALAVAPATLGSGCQTTPVTGRKAFNLFTPAQDLALGREAYSQILAGEPLVDSGPELQMVERVMNRLAAVADDPGYEWEVRLIDDPATVNAFALPGGKMAVYTGILPLCQDEAGLAVVMGHEIGHVVAQHGTERMSQAMGLDVVLSMADLGEYDALAQQGRSLLIELPFSRAHESEADHIGLIYMARAGYDPRAAPRFWERMATAGGAGPPELLSTHPSGETRATRLQELMPEALEVWRAAGGGP